MSENKKPNREVQFIEVDEDLAKFAKKNAQNEYNKFAASERLRGMEVPKNGGGIRLLTGLFRR